MEIDQIKITLQDKTGNKVITLRNLLFMIKQGLISIDKDVIDEAISIIMFQGVLTPSISIVLLVDEIPEQLPRDEIADKFEKVYFFNVFIEEKWHFQNAIKAEQPFKLSKN